MSPRFDEEQCCSRHLQDLSVATRLTVPSALKFPVCQSRAAMASTNLWIPR